MQGAFQTFEIASKIENCGSTKRVLPNARLLPGVADQKLGSRMDAPILVFDRVLKSHHSCGHFNRFAVSEPRPRQKKTKFSVCSAQKVARKQARRGVLVLPRDLGDLLASRRRARKKRATIWHAAACQIVARFFRARRRDASRSPRSLGSTSTPRRACLRATFCALQTENLVFFCRGLGSLTANRLKCPQEW